MDFKLKETGTFPFRITKTNKSALGDDGLKSKIVFEANGFLPHDKQLIQARMSTSVIKRLVTKQARRTRRGGISAFVLFAVPALMACVALALDIAMLSYQSRQMQAACDAAALAGVVELLDPAPLYSG